MFVKSFNARCALLALCGAIGLAAPAAALEAVMDSYRLTIHESSGAWAIANADGERLAGGESLCAVEFGPGERLEPQDWTARAGADGVWRFAGTAGGAELALEIAPQADRVIFSGEIVCREGVATRIALPGRIDLDGAARERFYWPRVLGVELNESYLEGGSRTILNYPPAFADFCAARIGGASLFFYRAEAEETPWTSQVCIQGGDPPLFWRSYLARIRSGERRRIPAMAIQVGGDLREALLRYKADCALGKPLDEKMAPDALAQWRRMAEVQVPAPADGGLEILRHLPKPAVAYITNWMFGGFNRQFPDFLPPNAAFGGEEGLREFVRIAHEAGHWVRPYVNFTWWSEGWEGPDRRPAPDSRPAPTLEARGEAALTLDAATGKPIREYYHGAYGYTACPGHPLVIDRARDTRQALADDYGVDMFYEDQLGARRWPLDANPALASPMDFGAALMRLGRESAALRPVATEWGHDRALEFAVTLNYWALPPLSPIHVITGEEQTPWNGEEGRSFPYALYLAGGDAAPQILDCRDPAWLAWAMLLGCRVSLGTASLAVKEGPDREASLFLQLLAEALAEAGAAGAALRDFAYLQPRVARAEYENHRIIANFSAAPWPLEDGGAIAPDGFDLRADSGLRAGRYVGQEGERVLAFWRAGETQAWTLAPGGFDLRLGGLRMRAEPPSVKRNDAGRAAALLDFGSALGGGRLSETDRASLAAAFAQFRPERIETFDEFEAEPAKRRILVNTHSQILPVRALNDWPADVARLREWIEGGGVWIEAGRWPAWNAAAPGSDESGGWTVRRIGQAGFENFYGERCWISRRRETPPQPRPLKASALGRRVLSAETLAALESQAAIVTVPPMDFPGALPLCANADGDYLMVHPLGYGAIVRLGGDPVAAAPAALGETVEAILDGRLALDSPAWRAPLCRQVSLRGRSMPRSDAKTSGLPIADNPHDGIE